jgi:hypothetical protein
MLCEERLFKTRQPCRYPARFLVVAPGAPRVVCGMHARQFMKTALVPLSIFGPQFNIDQLPHINGFLRAIRELGFSVSVTGTSIVINVPVKG